MSVKLPGVRARHKKLWVKVKPPGKAKTWASTPYSIGEEEDAAAYRVDLQNRLDAHKDAGLVGEKNTLDTYAAEKWIPRRIAQGVKSWEDDQARLKLHISPHIGSMSLTKIQARHINEVVQAARLKKKASRTVRNIYSVMQALFRDAEIDGLVTKTPCILTKYQLGRVRDSKKEWRGGAIYERSELVSLISDERLPWDRRVYYALAGLGMMRLGEVSGLRWRHWVKLEPLSRLVVTMSYQDGDTKTGVERWMPVHPVLAAMLAEWKLSGWKAMMERPAGADDLIVPTPKPTNRGPRKAWGLARDEHWVWKRLKADLVTIGLRHRRVHDLRRTGITLAREGGADSKILHISTHGEETDVMGKYTTLGWTTLCDQVACLKIERPRPPDLTNRSAPNISGSANAGAK